MHKSLEKQSLAWMLFAALLAVGGCGESNGHARITSPRPSEKNDSSRAAPSIPVYHYEVVKTWPHDPNAYTQGLEFYQDSLYESTGLEGRSSLRKVDLQTGKVLQQRDLPAPYFGEGITVFNGKIYQLTWRSQKGFIYDLKTFQPLGEFSYHGEGWGLTHDDQFLIMSDGTNQIRFLDSTRLQTQRTLQVFSEGQPLMNLNELEYLQGEIFANVYETDYLVRIHPRTGKILGWIDLTGLLSAPDRRQPVDVLNGIAYDSNSDRLVVTGKLWPKMFQIRLKGAGGR